MNIPAILAQLRGGGSDPRILLSAMAPLLTDGARWKLATLAELAEGAELIGPRPAPPAFARLFEEAGRRVGIPPALLSAVAVTCSGYDPAFRDGGRVGLMGLPLELVPGGRERVAGVTAEPEELVARDPGALAAVSLNVHTAAVELARLRGELPSRTAGALFHYLERGRRNLVAEDCYVRARVDAGRAAGVAVLLGLQELDADFVAAASAAFGGREAPADV